MKNEFLNKIKKKRLETCPLDDEFDILQDVDTTLLLVELRNCLNDNENAVLSLLLQAKCVDDICKTLNKSKSQIYKIMNNIKRKIKH